MEKDSNNLNKSNDFIENEKTQDLKKANQENDEISSFSEDETSCGLWGWNPEWLQYYASKKSYVITYGLLGSNLSAIGAYYIGIISTIEKRFKLPSASSGLIASAWDIGALSAAMIMAYFGGTGHKTRWVASGALIAAFSCYLRFIPHVLYGPGSDVTKYGTKEETNFTGDLCESTFNIEDNCSLESDSFTTFIILFMAHIAIGVGTSTYYTLGAAYLDDNALKNKVPFLFAVSTSLRMIGPSAGFLLASVALDYFVDPDITPPFKKDDPRWIGAWWLGWIPFGSLLIVFAFLMSLFPKTLPREAERRKTANSQWHKKKNKSIADFISTLKRLIKNPVLMFNSFSTTFYFFGMVGYYIFMPKYMETQFRVSASKASLLTGSIGLICMAIGVIASGAVVSTWKPRPRYLAAWNVFTESIDVLGHLLFAFLGCPKDDLQGEFNDEGIFDLTVDCNVGCNCSIGVKYSPICSWDNKTTFYSPCHAGCTTTFMLNDTKYYGNCSCIPEFHQARSGPCPVDCNNDFLIFLILLCFMKFLSSTGRSGNTIIQLRSVAPEDKAISIALTEVLLCVITFIPAPIIYGYIMDYSCLVWGMTCGKTGNCWLYNGKLLRYILNFTASSFLLIGTILDVGVFYKVTNLKIYDEEFLDGDKSGKKEDSMAPGTDLPLLNDHTNLT